MGDLVQFGVNKNDLNIQNDPVKLLKQVIHQQNEALKQNQNMASIVSLSNSSLVFLFDIFYMIATNTFMTEQFSLLHAKIEANNPINGKKRNSSSSIWVYTHPALIYPRFAHLFLTEKCEEVYRAQLF